MIIIFINFSLFLNLFKGIDNKIKKLVIDKQNIELNIWDTAGQERFKSVAKSYLNKSDGVILVFDLTNLSSFNSIEDWIEELNKVKKEGKTSLVLVGNKSDLKNSNVNKELIDELLKKYNLRYFETSAKENKNIKKAFEFVAKDIYFEKYKEKKNKSANKNDKEYSIGKSAVNDFKDINIENFEMSFYLGNRIFLN